jgi:site-specific DNA-adenine methylase
MTNKDYREVEIKPNSVVYCDIPYDTSIDDYGVKFDHAAFHEWAATRDFPVYFSEYKCDDPRFTMVWEKKILCNRNKKNGKGIYRTEKLFWNGVGV